MQKYNKVQKFISFLLIFSIFFSFTFHISFFSFLQTIFAGNEDNFNLVSIFVQEEIYNGVESSVNAYAKNIQGVLENTKTIIIPIPEETHPYNIASLNEKLYFEGYDGLGSFEGNSRLIGSVFIGDLPLPVVENNGSYEKTVLPYVDFYDKLYVFNEDNERYEYTGGKADEAKAEIWHGFISPNTGNYSDDIQDINDYLEKNDDFYNGNGKFENSKGIMNGNENDNLIEDYEPFVFYYDQVREQKALKYVEYKSYESYLSNIEDINYYRYSKDLTSKLSDSYIDSQQDYVGNATELLSGSIDFSSMTLGSTENYVPDIQTRSIVQNVTKNFINVFNEGTLGEFREDVHNAGRYNSGANVVNADLIPYLISSVDTLTQGIIKNVNNDLEKEIDNLVSNGLSRKLPVLQSMSGSGAQGDNYFYGTKGEDVLESKDCTIYRGNTNDGQLVEANRGYDVDNIELDKNECGRSNSSGYRGNNSPMELNTSAIGSGKRILINNNLDKATKSLFDIKGSLLTENGDYNPSVENCLRANIINTDDDPPSCSSYNANQVIDIDFEELILNFDSSFSGGDCEEVTVSLDGAVLKHLNATGCSSYTDPNTGETTTETPSNTFFSFKTIPGYMTHKSPTSEELSEQVNYMISPNLPIDKNRYIDFVGPTGDYHSIYYPQLYRATSSGTLSMSGAENILKEYLDDRSSDINTVISTINNNINNDWRDKTSCPSGVPKMEYNVKHINSSSGWKTEEWKEELISRKPTEDSLKKEKIGIYEMLRPDEKYNEDLTIYGEIQKIKDYIPYEEVCCDDIITTDCNDCCETFDITPSSKLESYHNENKGIPLAWKYFMNPEVDLYEFLKAKADMELDVLGDKKEMSYIDSLTFAIYWQNLNNISAKYKFVFDNYLSDQFADVDTNNFYFPKNKKMYEIAYLGAPGDAKNMYIKVAPEDDESPYSDISESNLNLDAYLYSIKDYSNNDEGNFECAPPEGVPIRQWLPAVMCRLEDMLPPTVSISDGHCGPDLFDEDDGDGETVSYSNEDINKNSIPDGLEEIISSGSLLLESESDKFYYNKTGELEASVLDSSGTTIKFDNTSNISFELVKVVGVNNEALGETIYDKDDSSLSGTGAREQAEEYINFTNAEARITKGEVKYNFSTKSKDADIIFRAILTLKDQNGNIVIEKISDDVTIEIRGDLFYISSYKFENIDGEFNLETSSEGIKSSSDTNIFLVEDESFDKNDLDTLNGYSNSKEKLFLSLSRRGKSGTNLNVEYPLKLEIIDTDTGEDFVEPINIDDLNLLTGINIKKSGIYDLKITDASGESLTKEITILAGEPIKIKLDLSTNLMENDGVITTNMFSLYDEFDNITTGDSYNITAEISGDSIIFEDDTKEKNFTTFEGYKAFRLKSTNDIGKSTISLKLENNEVSVLNIQDTINVVEEIKFEITGLNNDLNVGTSYDYGMNVLSAGDDKFSSRGYLISDSFYVESLDPYVDIEDNSGYGSLKTQTIAQEGATLEFKIEGVRDSIYKTVNILSGEGLKLDISLEKSQIEASSGSTTKIYAEIKDRYGNLVWDDNETQLTLEILPEYSHVISTDITSTTVSKGKGEFEIFGTEIPGTAYFKISTTPSLSDNSITIEGQNYFDSLSVSGMTTSTGILTDLGEKFFTYSGESYRFIFNDLNTLKGASGFSDLSQSIQDELIDLFNTNNHIDISGVGENIGEIETFYFWNKSKIDNNNYNSLYTTLLGSNYGDITVEDNLANSIIFDKNNKALSVTSTLNTLKKDQEIVNINPNGNLKSNYSYSDLSQSISSEISLLNDGGLSVSVYNDVYNSLVSNVYYNLRDFEFVESCYSSDITDCYKDDENSILLKSLNSSYEVEYRDYEPEIALFLKDLDGNILFEIKSNGRIINRENLTLELSNTQDDGLVLNLKKSGNTIGNMAINFVKGKRSLDILRDLSNLEELQDTQENGGIIFYIASRNYYYREKYLGSSTKGDLGYIISYNDPLGSDDYDTNNFGDNFESGYEEYHSRDSLGWEEENKILLSFSAGKTVGESTKDYMTFSLINIGDPVVKPKSIAKKLPGTSTDRKYDSTIGYQISNNDDNRAYEVFDYNNDGNEDIVILKVSKELELLEGTGNFGNFINRGVITYLPDLGENSQLIAGDFTGDGYGDLFLTSESKNPILLSNTKKDFKRINTNISVASEDGQIGEDGNAGNIFGNINQVKGYDMDKDGKADLVILDNIGNLKIYYGTSVEGEFYEKFIDDGLGLELNSDIRKSGGTLYFSGLYQLPDSWYTSLDISDEEDTGVNESLVDNLIFIQMDYAPESKIDEIMNNSGGLFLPESIMTDDMSNGLDNQGDSINDIITTFSGAGQGSDLSTGIDSIESGIQGTTTSVTDLLSNSLYNSDLSNTTALNSQVSGVTTTFIKSEYAQHKGIKIEKTYTKEGEGVLKGGDFVTLEINIINESGKKIENLAYNEDINELFSISSYSPYKLEIGGVEIPEENIIMKSALSSDYSLFFDTYLDEDGNETYISLEALGKLSLKINLETNSFDYGYINVGEFDDTSEHGDIVFKASEENCGQDRDLYKSTDEREYIEDLLESSCENDLPEPLNENTEDEDGNGVPDYIDDLIESGETGGQEALDYASGALSELFYDSDGDGIPDDEDISTFFNDSDDDFMNSLDKINEKTEDIIDGIDTILAGLSCGFGGGGCISSPLNRAPLAPGNDPTIFGMPIGNGLWVNEGMPVFSALNFMPAGPYCIPTPWPPGLFSPGCLGLGAGGRLGTLSPTNFIRIFVTPTLTGAVGIAICFGAPAAVVGISNPAGLHPFVPGGNCIIAAKPLDACQDDGSDGEIYNMGDGDIINGNCGENSSEEEDFYLSGAIASDYITYKENGGDIPSDLEEVLSTVASGPSSEWEFPDEPLFQVGDIEDSDISLNIDFGSLADGNFEDVIQLQMTRISSFPDFVMEWVTRQIEEIANKLTDFPTLYIILPDFSGVLDSKWSDFMINLENAYNTGQSEAKVRQDKIQTEIEAEKALGVDMNCSEDSIGCLRNKFKVNKLQIQKNIGNSQTNSGIKAVYEFLSNLPMIDIDVQKVHFNIPNIDETTIDKAVADFKIAKKQISLEFEKAKENWNYKNYACLGEDSETPVCKNSSNIESLINSIDRNIEILRSYKEIPEDIFKMLKIKEIRLEQILCNVEAISKMVGGRIGKNGKRFKAWVELYVLIKAILKSWQALIDLFVDFDAQCHECKNERRDLQYFIWKLISMVIPKIPVIQFPKWPDIYLDLHNIRVSLTIGVPEFDFNLRPITLPSLPELKLPDSPNINLNIPILPLLPEINLGELPLIPTLPSIDLPDLPPPPKLPKLFSSIAAFLDILKIITKVMCILKTSPFVPEWRAGDQIAFITERSGFLSIDFLDASLPQFSFPFVDAIKVSTYVNLEFEIDFLTEMARNLAKPLNSFENDISNMLNVKIGDLDFRSNTIEDVDIDIDNEGWIDVEGGEFESYNTDKKKKLSILDISYLIVANIFKLHSSIDNISKKELTTQEFKKEMANNLSSIGNKKLIGIWKEALNQSSKNENKFIDKLITNNENKFNEVKSILQEEIQRNSDLYSEINKKLTNKNTNTLISSFDNSSLGDYDTRLEKYNSKTIISAENLFKEDEEAENIRNTSKEIISEVKTGLNSFSEKIDSGKIAFLNSSTSIGNTLTTTGLGTLAVTSSPDSTDCTGGLYSYNYEGIYIVEEYLGKKISYNLTDYKKELSDDEVPKKADLDGDSDDDIVYMMGNDIYIKENYNNKKSPKNYFNGAPVVLDVDDNYYLDNDKFIDGVNFFRESLSDNKYINLVFSHSTGINNYRIEFTNIIDKFDDIIFPQNYEPDGIKKYIIDAFSNIDEMTMYIDPGDNYTKRNNLAYISNIDNSPESDGLILRSKELINLGSNDLVNAGTKIYSGGDNVTIRYYPYTSQGSELDIESINLQKHLNIEFEEDIIITEIAGNAYVEGTNFIEKTGRFGIGTYVGKPLLPGSTLYYLDSEVGNKGGGVSIKYYDETQIDLDFSLIKSYELYNLGKQQNEYLVRSEVENDFYYAGIKNFKNNLYSTFSNQIFLSPQIESDTKSPEIENLPDLKVPVYQDNIEFDITDSIYEDSGNIKDIYIDFDLDEDSFDDENLINDRDFYYQNTDEDSPFKIDIIDGGKIIFDIGIFDETMKKTIRIYVVDGNDNIGYKDVTFEVYAPVPNIQEILTQDIETNPINDTIKGRLDENLIREPINFYRLRGNKLDKLEDINGSGTTYTFDEGKFKFEMGGNNDTGLEVKDSDGNEILSINEETGKIDIKTPYILSTTVEVLSSNDNDNEFAYPKIVVSEDGEPFYFEYLTTPNVGEVQVVDNFIDVIEGQFQAKEGVYYKHNSQDYGYFKMPLGINKNAGDLFIYKSGAENALLVKIFKDGRVNIDSELHYLKYKEFGEYVVYEINSYLVEVPIGEILVIPEENYIIR